MHLYGGPGLGATRTWEQVLHRRYEHEARIDRVSMGAGHMCQGWKLGTDTRIQSGSAGYALRVQAQDGLLESIDACRGTP